MNRFLLFGLIIFFILVILLGILFLFKSAPLPPSEEKPPSLFPEAGQKPEKEASLPRAIKPEELKNASIRAEKPLLIQISAEPVAGFGLLKPNKARYVERATGHVFETDLASGETRLVSNTTIPKIFEAKFSLDGSKALLKYLEEEKTRAVSAEFKADSTKGVLLPGPVLDWGYYPNSSDIFYYLKTKDDPETFSVIKANYKNQNQREIYSSPFPDFNVSWPRPNFLSLTTKPSWIAPGFSYVYNPETQGFLKILSDISGLETKWNKEGEKLLYSDAGFRLFFYEYKTGKAAALNFNTLAAKCAFSQTNKELIFCAKPKEIPAGLYPDEWHQGVKSFSDEIWRLNIKTGEKELLYNEGEFDVREMEAGSNDEFLYFQDKNTGLFYALRLK
jgi:hypothetical protein